MDGNGPLRQAPAPHEWHQPYPPAPAPAQNRRWIPAAIISAGIIIAGAVVGGAVIMSHSNKPDSSAVAASGQPAAIAAAADSSTCQAWEDNPGSARADPHPPPRVGLEHAQHRHSDR